MHTLRNLLFILGVLFSAVFAAHAQDEIREYRLGPGDSVRVQVFQHPDLSLETRVSEAGTIAFPLVGSVKIGGLSLEQAAMAVAEKLASGKFVINPQVTMSLAQNLANQVSVLGQVNRPGRFPLETAKVRLSEIIASAGGIAPTGADMIVVTGTRDGQPIRREIDVSTMFLGTATQED